MIDKRYHVFICTSGVDMQAERVVLSQALVSQGFFSWGLEQRTPLTTAFARRQIDDCDYFVLLLGGCYGDLSASGVSYMHLEYIYAVTKQKPILVLMHEAPDSRAPELQEKTGEGKSKFSDFRQQLQRERDVVVSYRNMRDLEMAVRHAMPQMIERYPSAGWIRPQNTQKLQEEVDQLRQKIAQLELKNNVFREEAIQIPRVHPDELFSFDYKVHAYQDGNFKELRPQRKMKWGEILAVLGPGFSPAAPEENFSRVINEFLNQTSLGDVRQVMPRAHATARSQINIRALHTIKMQLKHNNWIVPSGRDNRQRLLWELTPQAEKTLMTMNQGKKAI
ncbi:DUF4062 domain-containing protein [Alkanindiges illinoisensis]|uniref:DUF4062 domain-containing protein n=1 Tax=Alkanindiges illinoisensis TaxID=197183 RepID=A0A4Y7XAG5_9GAMM|nr:DUF4062 domain-containing protein [Alkanindiges illinoisensis]TEU24969.1 DUF4062 domain-containing protein [Alkanindiges illinoisensis]